MTKAALSRQTRDEPGRASREGSGGLRLVNSGEDEPLRDLTSADPTPGSDGDGVLVRRALQGSADAFEALVRRHLRAAFMVARQLVASEADAEDVCQDAFIKALERLEECRNPERFRPWFLTIVRNRAHNFRKFERRRETESLDGLPVRGPSGPAGDLEKRELGRRLSTALDQLTDKQRQVVLLHDYEGWQHSEIGERLGISAGASRFNLHAARKKLRVLLADDRPEGGS